jgi:2-phospho-L-lactate guanylyltransferase (CobY/MobA/RfbA family)
MNEIKEPPVVVISPDRHEDGTNAMLMCPAGLINFHFGQNSFNRHCMYALQTGARLEIVRRVNLGLDLDFPDDLDFYEKIQSMRQESL